MTDMTRTLRHRYTVQIEIDPTAWDANYGPEDVQEDSRSYLMTAIEETVNAFLRSTGNRGRVRLVAWKGSGPGVPLGATR